MPHTMKPAAGIALRHLIACLVFPTFGLSGNVCAQETDVDTVVEQQSVSTDDSQESQSLINELEDSIVEDITATRVARQQVDRLLIYNDNLETLIADQEREIASLRRQIDEFGDIEQNVVPLMLEMIETLKRFVQLDMPFLQRERGDRIRRLEANMERSELTVSEKYRQIMEAYQIEAGYGRNIEAYIGTLNIDGVDRRVDILRVGRILLAYQTVDQSSVGFYDKTTGQWSDLDGSYRTEIADGLRIARRQMAPRLLELPLPAAGDTR